MACQVEIPPVVHSGIVGGSNVFTLAAPKQYIFVSPLPLERPLPGEIGVGLVNLSQQAYTIQPGERIAQLMIMPVAQAAFVQVDQLDETQRGEGGFGSTGRA